MATKKKTATPEVVEETKVTEEIIEQDAPEVSEKPVKSKKQKNELGVVTECEQLNVRNAASKVATRIAVISKGTEFEIESFESGSEWLKITTKTGIKGFVMAKFVTVK